MPLFIYATIYYALNHVTIYLCYFILFINAIIYLYHYLFTPLFISPLFIAPLFIYATIYAYMLI